MTIEKTRPRADDKGDWLVTCNEKGCRESLDAKDRHFQQAITFLRARGWRAYDSYGTWMHICDKCRQLANK